MHNVLTLQPAADPATTVNQVALYSKLVTGVPQLFYRPSNNQTPIQMTYPSLVNTGTSQYSFVAGPFIVYTGFITNPTQAQLVTLTPGSSLIYVDLTLAFPSNPLSTLVRMLVPTDINSPANTFKISYQTGLGNFVAYYFAIGV